MSKSTQPYAIIQRRVDIVTRVPAWASVVMNKGDQVVRLDSKTVWLKGRGRYKLGESYTRFTGYTESF